MGLFLSESLRVDLPAFPILVHYVELEIVLVTVILELNVTFLVAMEIFLGDDFADATQIAFMGFDVWSERADFSRFFSALHVIRGESKSFSNA